ncbi:MAG: ABC transporter permease subunit [Dehalococcoidia bacterium]|nr:ABC transporter permease subunit [Dehalococcoidia bacterium]
MRLYIMRRFLNMIPTLVGLSLIVFLLMRVIPGDATDLILEESPTAQRKDELRAELGLDRPLHEQYLVWIGGVVHGDLGTSFWTNKPVIDGIKRTTPVTVELALFASAVALIVALPIGIISAVRQDTIWDYLGRSVSIVALSVPNFYLGTLVIILPAVFWGWVPPVTYRPIWEEPLRNLQQFWLPSLVIGASASATLMRMTRSALLEVMRQDYIRTAQAKGLTFRSVVLKHALKNSLIPVVTIFGALVAGLLTGTVITETIFNLPGLGRLTIDAIAQRDYPQIQANVLLFGLVYTMANLAVDLSYAVLNPRIRYG